MKKKDATSIAVKKAGKEILDKKENFISSIDEKLKRLMSSKTPGSGLNQNIWSPSKKPEDFDKSYVVRMVPYHDFPDPFIELFFHYSIGNKSVICPKKTIYINAPCPICDWAVEIFKSNANLYASVKAKLRAYFPIVVRGEEFKADDTPNVKYFGISKTKYLDILNNTVKDEDYGDIWHPYHGTDLTVKYMPPIGDKKYGDFSIKPKKNSSQLMESEEKMNEIMESVPKWEDVFSKYLYDEKELQNILDKWISDIEDRTTSSSNEDGDDDEQVDEQVVEEAQAMDVTELQKKIDKVLSK